MKNCNVSFIFFSDVLVTIFVYVLVNTYFTGAYNIFIYTDVNTNIVRRKFKKYICDCSTNLCCT